jgi:hypothetical protein
MYHHKSQAPQANQNIPRDILPKINLNDLYSNSSLDAITANKSKIEITNIKIVAKLKNCKN